LIVTPDQHRTATAVPRRIHRSRAEQAHLRT
jgi:hypothetical protein